MRSPSSPARHADLNEHDYQAFVQAVADGRITALEET